MHRFTALLFILMASGHSTLRAQSSGGAARYLDSIGAAPSIGSYEKPGQPKIYAPMAPRSPETRPARGKNRADHPWKRGITATIFWVGEAPTANNPTPNNASSWDVNWERNFGGYDSPAKHERFGYRPKKFMPRLNPFYVALPYNDVAGFGKTRAEASKVIPWFKKRFSRPGKTVLKGQWICIRHGGRTCYAQWEDVGPFETDDWMYVFGNSRPRNRSNGSAGIDVSPAIRDYLGLKSGEKCDWRFVESAQVPTGPWKLWQNLAIPRSSGGKTETIEEKRARIERLRRERDAWYQRQPIPR